MNLLNSKIKLSVIIPAFNEVSNPYFLETLRLLKSFNHVEIIITGKDNNLLQVTRELQLSSCKYVQTETNSRAVRINLGLKVANAQLILIHHPRTLLNKQAIDYLLNEKNLKWGGFLHSFDLKHPLLKLTSWYSNQIRGKIRGIVYLDHCIFLRKEMFDELGTIPEVDIFEDTLLSLMLLKKFGKPKIIPIIAVTSAVRFKKNGIFRQSLINQYLKLRFLLGSNHKNMNKLYEKKTNLNSKYKK